MTWEAEGWEEGEEIAAELESAGTDSPEQAPFGNLDQYDDGDGYYSVADTRSAESQQVIYWVFFSFMRFSWNSS